MKNVPQCKYVDVDKILGKLVCVKQIFAVHQTLW